MNTSAKRLDPAVLAWFTGSETLTRHPLFRKMVYTEGVAYIAEAAGAHWLVDAIGANQYDAFVKAEDFQVWQLYVSSDSSADLKCGDGNGKCVFTQPISYTDFPEPGIKFYFTNGTLLLPSEY